jgi:hypothetical protein
MTKEGCYFPTSSKLIRRRSMKECRLFFFIVVVLVMQGCSMLNQPDQQSVESVDGKVMVNYYSKNAGESFVGFLKNPVATVPSRSVLEPGEYVEISDEELFASLWGSLTDEERADLLENVDTAEVEINDAIGADADSEAGRALLA